MCLVALAALASPRFPLVLAANRDELFARPAAPLAWWSPGDGREILAGRDLQAGGTWLGATRSGRIALVTNVREPATTPASAPSRGEIVARWLAEEWSVEALEEHVVAAGFAGVNVLAIDIAAGVVAHVSNRGRSRTDLPAGVHGLSNASIDVPWPKVTALTSRVDAHVASAASREALEAGLFAALASESLADPAQLPSTGIPAALELRLSAAFIRIPEMAYGTRCSSVLVLEDDTLYFTERTFAADPRAPFTDRTQTLSLLPPLRSGPFASATS